MDDRTTDSQDSETSSTSSWILLSNEEAAADLESAANQGVFFREVAQNLTESDFKNNQSSDIESDGISVISENEFLQNSGKTDDEAVVTSDEEKFDNTEELFEDLNEILEAQEQCTKIHKTNDLEETNHTEGIEQYDETIVCDKIVSEINPEISPDILHKEQQEAKYLERNTSVVSKSETDTSILNCLSKLREKYDYKKLLTWPSLLCTSVVIFAVLIFPCSLSTDENGNSVEQPNLGQYDMKILSDKNNINEDPLIYCKEIHKDDMNKEYNVKKCLKRILKQNKFLRKNQKITNLKYFDGEIYDAIHEDISFFNQDININNYDNTMYKNDGKKYHHQKYRKKHDNTKTQNIPSDDLCYGEYCQHSQKDMSSNEKYISNEHKSIMHNKENFNGKIIFNNEENKKMEKPWKVYKKNGFSSSQERLEKKRIYDLEAKLKIKENTLKEKEQSLKKWENELKEKEKKLEAEMNASKKENIKRKGDIDEKPHTHKYWKNKAQKKNENNFKEKKKEENRFPKKWEKTYKMKELKLNEYEIHKNARNTNDLFPNNKFRLSLMEKEDELFQRKHKNFAGNNIDLNNSVYQKLQNIPRKNFTSILREDDFSVTGEWYLNLLRGRQDIRKREEKAVWWFDRAEYRKNKRNKAYWYFQYMFNRENLRYRPRSI